MKTFIVIFVITMAAVESFSHTPPPYYHKVAHDYGVPVNVLYAVALNESGLTKSGVYNPWPWTLNINGEGKRFNTFHEAKVALQSALHKNYRVDIGIMQINSYWHRDRVATPLHFLQPSVSVTEGAKILLEQRRRSDDWWEAVGRYHAPSNDAASLERAEAYRLRVKKIYQNIVNNVNKERNDDRRLRI